ncbi:hypothetical protein P154DRAFT_595775 [Amniculicola lignicola CBS 123094]|uniref:Mid2 domain-containing protein n=1 Tax=Amniculicola lignicola CBS 123094 TaxID=1392246 RepID=A0A6A5WLT8_9PLEO|nr:hypothetical protein P154DRAFT_595775 [Amniculicola lignicola CBS 123094]
MLFSNFKSVVYGALTLGFVVASPSPVGLNVRNAPGASTADTFEAIRRELSVASLQRRDNHTEISGNATLDRSWNNAVLLAIALEGPVGQSNVTLSAGVSIECETCYIKGLATAALTIPGNFSASQAIELSIDSIKDEVQNFTNEVDEYFEDYLGGVIKNFGDGIDLADFAFPTFNYSFDMDIPSIPECNLSFGFDSLELYMKMNTVLGVGATYELNLYTSTSPVGISITKDLELGVIFAVDLILSAAGEIDISSGFHLKLDDGLAINIPLFGDEVSDIVFNGGQFEFLPVTLVSSGIVLSAVLRVGIHAGFTLVAPKIPKIEALANFTIPSVGGGIEVGVFANIAEFITNVTYVPDDEECELKVVENYQIALGAVAGASIQIGDNTWGPVAATSVPIWFTELAAGCAIKGTPKATPIPTVTATPTSAAGNKRQEASETKTITSEVTYTGVTCVSTGLVNCPASLQATSQYISTTTLITFVAEDVDPTFPVTVQDAVPTTVDFGSSAQKLTATTGSPISYVPPPPPPSSASTISSSSETGSPDDKESILDGEVGGVNKKLVVGVSVGVGVPVLIAIIAGIMFFIKRRRYSAVPKMQFAPSNHEPYRGSPYADNPKPYKQSNVYVREVMSR